MPPISTRTLRQAPALASSAQSPRIAGRTLAGAPHGPKRRHYPHRRRRKETHPHRHSLAWRASPTSPPLRQATPGGVRRSIPRPLRNTTLRRRAGDSSSPHLPPSRGVNFPDTSAPKPQPLYRVLMRNPIAETLDEFCKRNRKSFCTTSIIVTSRLTNIVSFHGATRRIRMRRSSLRCG
jgi:hypothetical protein